MLKEYTHAQEVLTTAYNHFNKQFAGGELKDALITVQSVGRKRAYGWFAQNAWKNKDEKTFHEINIGAEHFKRSNDDIFETLLHEMAHLWNHQNGIDDCTVTQYHKKTFADAAKRFGLTCEKMGRFGYAKTGLADESRKSINELTLSPDVFSIFRSFGNNRKVKEQKYITIPISIDYLERLQKVMELTGEGKKGKAVEAIIDEYLSVASV